MVPGNMKIFIIFLLLPIYAYSFSLTNFIGSYRLHDNVNPGLKCWSTLFITQPMHLEEDQLVIHLYDENIAEFKLNFDTNINSINSNMMALHHKTETNNRRILFQRYGHYSKEIKFQISLELFDEPNEVKSIKLLNIYAEGNRQECIYKAY